MVFTAAAMADDHPEHSSERRIGYKGKNDVLAKMESSKSYLKSAEKIVAQGNNSEAASLLKNAQLMMKEGYSTSTPGSTPIPSRISSRSFSLPLTR